MEEKSKSENTEQKSLKAIKNLIIYAFLVTVIAVIFVFAIYRLNFSGEFSVDQHVWGSFGDYFAGILNPVISFCALIALFVTIIIQSKELNLSRKELEYTRNELKKSADAAERQIRHIEIEAKQNETYKIIEKISDRIDKNLDDGCVLVKSNLYSINQILYSHKNSSAYRLFTLTISNENHHPPVLARIKEINSSFSLLIKYLEKYKGIADNKQSGNYLKEFYITEYLPVVTFFKKHNLIEDEISDYYFK